MFKKKCFDEWWDAKNELSKLRSNILELELRLTKLERGDLMRPQIERENFSLITQLETEKQENIRLQALIKCLRERRN